MANTLGDVNWQWRMDTDEAELFAHDLLKKIDAYRAERINNVRNLAAARKGGAHP